LRFDSRAILLGGICAVGLAAPQLYAAPKGALQAGAAKVDITPDVKAIPRPYTSILDPLYVRAIYLDNGHDKALLMNGDLGTIADTTYSEASKKIAAQLNIPIPNILISATHDHSAIFFGDSTRDKEQAAAWIDKVEAAMVKAANDAKSAAQPARIGYGTEMLYLNVNRDVVDEKTRLWEQQPNLEYPSDKTLAVIRIETLSGEPIAVYMNYAMHAISLFLDGKVSGDFPGEAERYLEKLYHDKAVVLWTSGAAGDQNPLYVRANGTISNARIHALMDAEHVDVGTGTMRAMFVGNPASDNIAIDPVAMEESLALVKSEGQITAEAAIRAMSNIRTFNTEVEIEAGQDIVTCAGRKRLDTGREGAPGQYEDSPDPIKIRIGALRIGDIALGAANAELYSMIGQRVKQSSKLHDTMVVTLTNGFANSGYVPTDDAFGRYTFQVLSSRLKPGCAEPGIEHGIDQMIEKMD
jgi:neutral ceramidase